jgi:hypothetical protein
MALNKIVLLIMLLAFSAQAEIPVFNAETGILTVPIIAMQSGDDLRIFEANIKVNGDKTCSITHLYEFFCGFSPVNAQCDAANPVRPK